jgi:hypothetical protein
MNCELCKRPIYDQEGKPTEDTWVYQIIDGRPLVCRVMKLGIPMRHVHFACIEAVH